MYKKAIVNLIFLVALLASAQPVWSQTDIYVKGAGRLFPVAVPRLCLRGGSPEWARTVPAVIARDLDLSGYFQVIDPNAYIEDPDKCTTQEGVAYSDWSIIGSEGLVKGLVENQGSEVRVQLFLHDVIRQKVVLGKEYVGDVDQLPKMAHKFANEIMKFFTGEMGVFGTQIAYSSRIGRFKELFVMDMDGSNIRQLTSDNALALSAGWHPNGRRVLFTSYRNRVPDLFSIDTFLRKQSQVTRTEDLEIGGKFDMSGQYILASISLGRQSDIVLMNQDGQIIKRITNSRGTLDVSPVWSPDGTKIAFCSNRAGGPQIYTMNADGSQVQRVSFVVSNYCTSPAWAPKGGKIAFVCRADRGFQLFVANEDGTNPLQLTSYGDNEDPDWAPNGQHIVFASTFGKGSIFNLALVRSDGAGLKQLTNSRTGDMDPAWGPLPK